jgi:thioredoxin
MSKNIIHFSPNDSFDKEVIEASKTSPVMVDFFATWCGPCKKLSPLLEDAANKYGFKLVVVDVDKNGDLSNEYNVSSIPHVFCFHKGSKIMDFKGYDTNSLEKMVFYILNYNLLHIFQGKMLFEIKKLELHLIFLYFF